MRFLLQLDVFVHAAELLLNALDLIARGFGLLRIHLHGSGSGQPTLRAGHDRHHHLQIA